jgi:hypothetical protein
MKQAGVKFKPAKQTSKGSVKMGNDGLTPTPSGTPRCPYTNPATGKGGRSGLHVKE